MSSEKKDISKILFFGATFITILNIVLVVMAFNAASLVEKVQFNYEEDNGVGAELEGAMAKLGYSNMTYSAFPLSYSGVAEVDGLGNVFIDASTEKLNGSERVLSKKVEFRKVTILSEKSSIDFYIDESKGDVLLGILQRGVE